MHTLVLTRAASDLQLKTYIAGVLIGAIIFLACISDYSLCIISSAWGSLGKLCITMHRKRPDYYIRMPTVTDTQNLCKATQLMITVLGILDLQTSVRLGTVD